jgi:hypothetical protein
MFSTQNTIGFLIYVGGSLALGFTLGTKQSYQDALATVRAEYQCTDITTKKMRDDIRRSWKDIQGFK